MYINSYCYCDDDNSISTVLLHTPLLLVLLLMRGKRATRGVNIQKREEGEPEKTQQ